MPVQFREQGFLLGPDAITQFGCQCAFHRLVMQLALFDAQPDAARGQFVE